VRSERLATNVGPQDTNQGSNRSNRSDGAETRILRRRRAPARYRLNCGACASDGDSANWAGHLMLECREAM